MAAENQSAETSASHQRQKTHRQQKTLVSSHRQALTQNLTQLSHYLALRSALYYLLSLLIFIYYQTTSIHWEFCFSLISIHLEFYSSRNQVFQTRDQRHFPKKIKSWKLNFAFLRTQAFKTRDLYDIIIVCMVSNSKSKKQVFKSRVLYSTQFSKTQYTSLQLYFKRIVDRTIFYTLTLLISKIPWILRVKLLSPLESHIDYKLFLFFSLLGLVQSFWELRHRATHRFGKKKKEMNGNKINAVFYAESYHPIQAGSIDGTDILPHDNAIYRAHLCASAGLCIYTPLSLSLSPPILTIPILPLTFRSFFRWPLRRSQGHRRPLLHRLRRPPLSPHLRRHSSRGLFSFQPLHSLFGCWESSKENK